MGLRGIGVSPGQGGRTEAPLGPDEVGKARRGLQRGRAEHAAPSPGPLSPSFPTTRPLPAPLPLLRLPPSPPPRHRRTRPPPPQSPPTSPFPRFSPPLRSTQKLQARRLLRTAPIFPSRVRFSHRRGAARRGGGEEPGRPPQRQVCTLMLPSFPEREERKGPVKAPRAPPPPPLPPSLSRRSARGSRDASVCFHAAASSPGAPLPPRSSSFSLFLSRSGAGIYLPPPARVAAEVSLRAGEPPPSAPPPGHSRKGEWAVRKASAGRPRETCGASRGGREGKGRPAAHSNGILSRAGPFGPPRGGREATSNNIGDGVVGTTFCGSARPPPARVFVRPLPAEPGGAPGPCRPPPGPGRRGAAGGGGGRPGPAKPQVHARGASRVPTRVMSLVPGLEIGLSIWFFLRQIKINAASTDFQRRYGLNTRRVFKRQHKTEI